MATTGTVPVQADHTIGLALSSTPDAYMVDGPANAVHYRLRDHYAFANRSSRVPPEDRWMHLKRNEVIALIDHLRHFHAQEASDAYKGYAPILEKYQIPGVKQRADQLQEIVDNWGEEART